MATTANSLITTQTTKLGLAICTAAKTTYNDAANAVALFTAGADGSLLKKLKAVPRATVTDTQLQLYVLRGGVYYLLTTKKMAAYTMAQTTECAPTDFGFTPSDPLRLQAGDQVLVAAGVALASGIVFEGEYEDF